MPDGVTKPDLAELAARTPATRDRYVDFLRAASIVTVVVGHWLIGVIHWRGGLIRTASAIGLAPGIWLGTWLFMIMPIFFFVGGFSNLVSYDSAKRRGESTWSFVRSRIERLLRPSVVFLAIWAVVQIVLHLTDTGRPTGWFFGDFSVLRGMRPPPATVPFGPLWFLVVYLIVVTMSPLTIALHRRFGVWVPIVMLVGTIVVDVIGFGFGASWVRFFNVAFVLLLPHQLGHFYAEGRMTGWPRWVFGAMIAVGLGALVLLTNPWVFDWLAGDRRFDWFPAIGHYPRSLMGTDVEPISNAYPPTVCYLAVGIWQIGAVMLFRDAANRWLQRERPWKVTIFLNGVIMTLFLWHMTAYMLAIFALWPLGLGQQGDTTLGWWLERPIWEIVPGIFLAAIVIVFGRFERGRARAA